MKQENYIHESGELGIEFEQQDNRYRITFHDVGGVREPDYNVYHQDEEAARKFVNAYKEFIGGVWEKNE